MKKLIFILLFFVPLTTFADTKDIIREARLNACIEGYESNYERIEEIYKHDTQNPIVRCATMMTLIYAFESSYGTSEKCLNDKNCFGIKQPGQTDLQVDYEVTTNRFLRFDNFDDGNKAFAMIYFKWNFNKDIRTYIYDRTTTDQEAYISFIKQRYWDTFWEIQTLYDNM